MRSIDEPWEDETEIGWLSEFVSVHGDEWLCWVECVPGMRIKTAIPKQSFELRPGDEFIWLPKSKIGHPRYLTLEQQKEYEEIGRDLEKFRQKRIMREIEQAAQEAKNTDQQ